MSSFALKIAAMLTMLIDHVGYTFQPQIPYSVYILCRTTGRLAMPLFCFMIAEGLFHTRDAKRYLARLAVFALVSEVPFDLLFNNRITGSVTFLEYSRQNVGFTLFLGFLGILLFDSFAAQGRKGAALAAILSAGAAAYLMRSDYTVYGVYYIFVFYYFRDKPWGRAAAFAGGVFMQAAGILFTPFTSWHTALYSLAAFLAVIPIGLYNGERGRKGRAYLFYAFYPLHLLVLYAIKLAVG